MYYPRFTKLIVNFFMSKDPSIPRRNKINWHYARDDPMFTTINVISKHEDTQLYGAILPKELTNKDIRNSESYKEYYAIASGEVPPKTKASVHKKKVDSDTTPKEKPSHKPQKTKESTNCYQEKSNSNTQLTSKWLRTNDEEEQEEDDEDEEKVSDQLVHTPSDYQTPDESEKQKDDDRVKDAVTTKDTKDAPSDSHGLLLPRYPKAKFHPGKEAESSKEPTRKESRTTSSSKGASRSQPTNLNETTHLEFITGDDDVIPAREVQDERQWHPPTSPTPDREWHLTKTVSDLPPQHWITDLAQAAGTQSSFDEFMATLISISLLS
ncbi:hypothetical protein Tco_0326858 [Tanacetum coccineum]